MDYVTGFGSSSTTEAGKFLLPKIKKHIGFLYKYKENLKSVDVAAEKLDAKRTDANRFAEDTNRKLKDVGCTATYWQFEADQLYKNAQIINSADNISCLYPWSRYSTSKNASELARAINEKVKGAPDFGIAFDRPPPESGAKFNLKGFMEFDSRLTVLNAILEALADEEVSMCSICGMGGVGKTTLAKKLILRVEADCLFDKVAMVTVSQNVNLEVIQNEIIELLGLTVGESTMPARANKLNAWLTDNRTLLILDDVWWHLIDEDFENIGIPLARKGCKIVVTSRNEDECKKMGCQQNFLIDVLKDGEAWDLFLQNAGKCVEDLNLQETARNIADECDGLPIAIVAIATALKDKPRAVWDDSLLQLQKSNLNDISGMEKVYSRIQLSYDLLNDQEAQSCFRLCCLFPDDHNIAVEHLVFYGKGLQLFENVESMKEARDRVESIIHRLKKSFLLLEGEKDGSVKMHDIVHDFAISVSSKDRHPYIVGYEKVMEKWPTNSEYEHCNAISFMCDEINEHFIDLRCPKLELLQLMLKSDRAELPIGIFEGLKELKVLVLEVPSLLQPLTTLRKLRTLLICENSRSWNENEEPKIGDLLGHGDLKNLEILEFASDKLRNDFPEEVGLLCNLRCLRFNKAGFEYMPSGVLSKLVKLEELELPWNFISWGCKEERGERVNARLDEIQSLPLTTLKISLTKGSILSEKLAGRLIRFHVRMVSSWSSYHVDDDLKAVVEVFDVDAYDVRANWISSLLKKCESLRLGRVRNLKNIIMSQDNVFSKLKDIEISGCNEMEYLVDTIAERIPSTDIFSQMNILVLYDMDRLKEICHYPYFSNREPKCFSNLSKMDIYCCPKLKHVFPLSVATELRQLQSIYIWDCAEMEQVFYRDRADDGNQVVSSVQLITPSLETTSTVADCSIDDDKRPQVNCPTPYSNSFIRCFRGREKQPKMEYPKLVSTPQIMEDMNIKKIDDDAIIFPQLKILRLLYMHKLRILYDGDHTIKMPLLEEAEINYCSKMEGLSYGSFNAPRLKEIRINETYYTVAGEDLNAIVKKINDR